MNQWDIVLVLVVLVDLFATVYNPMSKNTKENTKTMARLNVTMETTNKRLESFENQLVELETKNHNSHKRIWEHIEDQDRKIQEHDTRICFLEKGEEKNERKNS